MIPETRALRSVLSTLQTCHLNAFLGGSGLLYAFGLSAVVNDWDLTTNASKQAVTECLQEFQLVETPHQSLVFCSDYVLAIPEAKIEIIGGYAIRCERDVCRLPSVFGRLWHDIPIASPEVWAVAYNLMGRIEKSELLFRHLQRTGVTKNIVDLLCREPLPIELHHRLETLLAD
ncbi:hypothetical protein [Alicyclobacillus sp. SO9]|uniref:hypothetical protein n=1 Tax=Alicyclobacillus sp. SO9 TaxID=2665646 RepID=UPI0018E890D8|nr:hypothetical protein [Alicyclobacillus sp. SO9]QQE77239.1 hypothetical protein GI364_14865 [Alicyclobacillus sp. SO9]